MVEYSITEWTRRSEEAGGITMASTCGFMDGIKWTSTYEINTAPDLGSLNASIDEVFATIDSMAAEQEQALKLIRKSLDCILPSQRQEVEYKLRKAETFFFSKKQLYEDTKKALILLGDEYACYSAKAIADSYRQFLALLVEDLANASGSEEKAEVLQDIIEWVERAPVAYRLRLKNYGVPWGTLDHVRELKTHLKPHPTVWASSVYGRGSTSATALFVMQWRGRANGR
jgi:polyribonucleotide nucleotidyltransferase